MTLATRDGPSTRVEADRALFERYARRPTPELRTALVERFMPLARRLGARYSRTREPLEDIVQVAALGLIKAIDRYDLRRGIAFSSFAVPTIAGEIKRHLRDRTWSVHVPRDLQELAVAVRRRRAELESRLGRSPTVGEIALRVHASEEDVLEALVAADAQQAGSLDTAPGDHGGDEAIVDLVAGEDRGVDIAEARATLTPLMQALPQRSRLVLLLRFRRDMTQAEIGELIGVSQMQVSRIIRDALGRLRAAARAGNEQAESLLARGARESGQ